MTIRTRVSMDRRNTSRVMARMDCTFVSDTTRHSGVIVDVSMKGAFISSEFLPPNGASIAVECQPKGSKKPISFDATVLRGTWVMSDHGKMGRFGIRLAGTNPDLMLLVAKLNT